MSGRIVLLCVLGYTFSASAQDCVPFRLPRAGVDATYSAVNSFETATNRFVYLASPATESLAQVTTTSGGSTLQSTQRTFFQTSGSLVTMARSETDSGGVILRQTYNPALVVSPQSICAGATFSIPSVTLTTEAIVNSVVVSTMTTQTQAESASILATSEPLTTAGRTFPSVHERRQTTSGPAKTSDGWTFDGLVLRQRTTEASGQTNYDLTAVSGLDTCATPGSATLSANARQIVAGQSLASEWTREVATFYKVLLSRPSMPDVVYQTADTSILIPTETSSASETVTLRVRAIQDCGAEGPDSNPITIEVRPSPPSFVVARRLKTFLGGLNGIPPQTMSVRSTGPGPVNVTATIRGLANVLVEPSVLSLTLPFPENEITVSPGPRAPGTYTGLLDLTGGGFSATERVTIVVSNTLPQSTRIRLIPSQIIFRGPPGQPLADQQVQVAVEGVPATGGPFFLVPSSGPGCEWAQLGADVYKPLTPGQQVQVSIRNIRSDFGYPPLEPLLCRLGISAPGGANPAYLDVYSFVDAGNRSAAGERGSAQAVTPPPGSTSFIVPSAVNVTTGSGQTFRSDGWLTNHGPTEATVNVYFTPDGKDGHADGGLLATTLKVGAGRTFRLADNIQSVFGATGTSGQLELRSPQIPFLSLRAAVDSQLGDDRSSLYGSEIPAVAFGAGVGLGQGELVVPGIDNDAANRANLILTETTGKSATVSVSVNGPDGKRLGTAETTVPPYGKVQINRVAEAAGVGTLSGGWAGVSVISGEGRVVAVATVIDNRSGSFSAVLGRGARPAAPAAGTRPLAVSTKYVLPTSVRTTGANNTLFTTNLSLVNAVASPANLTLTYVYTDLDDGNQTKSVQKAIVIPGRGALLKAQGSDALLSLFGVSNRSFGYIVVEGDVQKVVGVVAISALVDPADPSKGVKTAQVNGVFLDSKAVLGTPGGEVRFAGAEKSSLKRTNLILLELGGQGADVRVRLRGLDGTTLAQRVVSVAAGQYFQINDVFGDQGVALGEGPFQDVQVSTELVSTGGKILAFATVNDNISRNPEIFILQPAGPPVGSTIGF